MSTLERFAASSRRPISAPARAFVRRRRTTGFPPRPGGAVAAEEEGQQLAPAGDAEMPVEASDVLVERRPADPQAQGGLLLAVAVEEAVERLPPARRQGTPARAHAASTVSGRKV